MDRYSKNIVSRDVAADVFYSPQLGTDYLYRQGITPQTQCVVSSASDDVRMNFFDGAANDKDEQV
jgi:hypothetical protein